jgi:hypothetical protein
MTDARKSKARSASDAGKKKHQQPPSEQMADPRIHDGAAQAPGGPEPGDDPRQGYRSQKNSI